MHHHPHHPHPHLLLRSLLSSQFGTKSKTTDLTNFFLQLKKPPNSLLPFSGFVLNEKLQRNALQFAIFYIYTYKAKSRSFEISFCVRPKAFLTVFLTITEHKPWKWDEWIVYRQVLSCCLIKLKLSGIYWFYFINRWVQKQFMHRT